MARKSGSFAQTTGPRVRAAALRLFAQHGYAAVSMRQIAAEVGLQAGALYSYTPDKQALLSTLLLEHFEALVAQWAAQPQVADPTEMLQRFSQFYLQFHGKAQETTDLARLELRNLSPKNREKIAALEGSFKAALVGILESGAEDKLFATPDTDLAATAVLGLLASSADWARGGTLPAERQNRIVWNMVRRAVGAKGFQ